jgi:succinate-acetate transporter protein
MMSSQALHARRLTSAPPARIDLQPIAEPAVLGSFSLASGLVIFGLWFAGAFGDPAAPETFFPFVLLFSGVGQLAAAMWAYRARDAVVASINGSWAAFWLGWGVLWILVVAGDATVPRPGETFPSLGMWFMYMAVITWTTAVAALARGLGPFVAQAVVGAGALLAAIDLLSGGLALRHAAGWVLVASAGMLFYLGAAIMLDNVFGMHVLPTLRWGEVQPEPVQVEGGDPGVKVGQ